MFRYFIKKLTEKAYLDGFKKGEDTYWALKRELNDPRHDNPYFIRFMRLAWRKGFNETLYFDPAEQAIIRQMFSHKEDCPKPNTNWIWRKK